MMPAVPSAPLERRFWRDDLGGTNSPLSLMSSTGQPREPSVRDENVSQSRAAWVSSGYPITTQKPP